MKLYRVQVYELYTHGVYVLADSPEDARLAARQGEGVSVNEPTYAHNYKSNKWEVTDKLTTEEILEAKNLLTERSK